MATRTKPFETFGPYILFKKLEEHAIGDLWRAGKIEDSSSIRTVALHRLNRGNGEALRQAVLVASANATGIIGTSIVRNQVFAVVDGVAVIEHDYNGGRTLRHIVAKARSETSPRPIPTDQALAVAEKVAAAIELIHNIKRNGYRAVHGAVFPQFVWVEEDGEIRLGAQMLGKGLLAALSLPAVASQLAPYIAPEVRSFGEPSAAGDIYATGAILYLALTGNDPPDPANEAQLSQSISHPKLMSGEPVPEGIRTILQRSLSPDINSRYNSAADLRQALGALLHGGVYAATTFNLAFYLHNLLKKEFEGEAIDREKEGKVTPALYAETSAEAPPAHREVAGPLRHVPSRRSPLPLIIIALLLLGGAGFGAYYVLIRGRQPAAQLSAQTSAAPAQPSPLNVIPELVSAIPSDTIAPVALDTAAAEQQRRKRIEQAVQRQLQEEMMKLQAEYERQLERQRRAEEEQSRETAEREERAAASRASEPSVVASREEQPPTLPREEPPPVPTTAIASTAAPDPVPTTTTQAPAQIQPAPAQTQPAPAQLREGDLVGLSELDRKPEPRAPIRPVYPPIALRQRLEATVFLTALISETGEVLEVRVLRGDPRPVGFDQAAIRAVRATTFSSPMKDGRRVRTWVPIPIRFQP
jgi:TonB family protein